MPGITKAGGGWNDRDKADLVARVLSGALDVREACARYGLSVECLREWVLSFRRSAILAFDQHLRDSLFARGIELSEVAPAGFTGSLSDISIADLIQTMTLGRRDSLITISHDGSESRIWCTAGEIVDAESGRLRGEPALYRALALERGHVVADFTSTHRIRTIHASTSALLLNAARRADECRRLKERLGPARYVVGPRVMAAGAKFSAGEPEVLRQFYAANAVADALARAETGDLENLKLISQLVAKDYLVPDRASDRPSTPPLPGAAMSVSPTVMSFLSPGRRRSRALSGSRRRALGSLAALGLLGLAGWLASPTGEGASPGRSLAPSPPATTAGGAAASSADEREPAAATLMLGDALAADAGLLVREPMNAPSDDGATLVPTAPASSASEPATPALAIGAGSAAAPGAAVRTPAARNSTVRALPARTAQRKVAVGDDPGAPVPRMQIIEEQPLRMQIVE